MAVSWVVLAIRLHARIVIGFRNGRQPFDFNDFHLLTLFPLFNNLIFNARVGYKRFKSEATARYSILLQHRMAAREAEDFHLEQIRLEQVEME